MESLWLSKQERNGQDVCTFLEVERWHLPCCHTKNPRELEQVYDRFF